MCHGRHAVATYLTCGLWGPFWIVATIRFNRRHFGAYRNNPDRLWQWPRIRSGLHAAWRGVAGFVEFIVVGAWYGLSRGVIMLAVFMAGCTALALILAFVGWLLGPSYG
jgi:hypothetical protein